MLGRIRNPFSLRVQVILSTTRSYGRATGVAEVTKHTKRAVLRLEEAPGPSVCS